MPSRRHVLATSLSLVLPSVEAQTAPPHAHLEKPRAQARGRVQSFAAKTKKTDERIATLISQVDAARLTQSVARLAALQTRWSMSPRVGDARDAIIQSFKEGGHGPNVLRTVRGSMPGGQTCDSILCVPPRLDQGFVLIGAHYDSISQSPAHAAPGANDNASGIAVLLELARILRGVGLQRGVMFAAFSGEEQGLYGSKSVAALAMKEKWAIDVMVNLDMVGWVDPARPSTVTVEFDQGNKVPTNDAAARAFGLLLAQAAADYTSLAVEHTDIWNSDYMPFEEVGYPCVGLYDGGTDSAVYHSASDLPDGVSPDRLAQVTGLLLAFVAQTASLA